MKKKSSNINRIAIIPARGGSKRIKNKNIKLFNGKPMISYPILELKRSNIFKKIFVSTEKKIIETISKKFGASVDFLRPKYLSRDNIPIGIVLKNVLLEFEKKNEIYDEIWLVYACNPLLSKKDLLKARNNFQNTSKKHPMISIKEFEVPIEWGFNKKRDTYQAIDRKKLYTDSKKIKKKYFECASFAIYTRKHILDNKKYYKYYGYLMQNHKAIDIDTKKDWEHALKLYKINNYKT